MPFRNMATGWRKNEFIWLQLRHESTNQARPHQFPDDVRLANLLRSRSGRSAEKVKNSLHFLVHTWQGIHATFFVAM